MVSAAPANFPTPRVAGSSTALLRRTVILLLMVCGGAFLGACGPMEDGGDVSHASAHLGRVQRQPSGVRYPIVLHHGFLGFDRIMFVDYFYGVKAALQRDGHQVFETRVSPLNTIAHRAETLRFQIDEILARTGAAKVNIVAHSMGGLDARHLISALGYGDRVASLIMLGTPNRGTLLADLALGFVDGSDRNAMLSALTNLFLGGVGDWRWLASAGTFAQGDDEARSRCLEVNIEGALYNLSERFLKADFESSHPMDSRVVYESYQGHSTWLGIGGDQIDPLLSLPFGILRATSGDNDGLVSVESARYGEVRGLMPADHINLIGQLFGRTSYDHLQFFREIAHDLKVRGF